jgi:hypothetical protein
MPAASIIGAKAVEFIKEFMYRFGIPNNIITDNGTQFIVREFRDFYTDLASRLTMHQCHTHRVMVKWSVLMV